MTKTSYVVFLSKTELIYFHMLKSNRIEVSVSFPYKSYPTYIISNCKTFKKNKSIPQHDSVILVWHSKFIIPLTEVLSLSHTCLREQIIFLGISCF